MTKHIVKVWDEQFEITVVQKSKSVWIAAGQYMGKMVEVQGRSESSAVPIGARPRGTGGTENPVYSTRTPKPRLCRFMRFWRPFYFNNFNRINTAY